MRRFCGVSERQGGERSRSKSRRSQDAGKIPSVSTGNVVVVGHAVWQRQRMNQVTLNILIQVGVGTILAAVVKFYFDRKFEQFRSELQKAAAQKNVQYSRVFDEIAHAISETYSKLISLHLALDDYTRPPTDSLKNDTSLDERFKVVVGMYKDFEVCFAPRCLFLPAKTGELIDSFTHTVKNAILEFKRSVELSDWTRSRTGHGPGPDTD